MNNSKLGRLNLGEGFRKPSPKRKQKNNFGETLLGNVWQKNDPNIFEGWKRTPGEYPFFLSKLQRGASGCCR